MSVQADISISQSIRNIGKSYDGMIKMIKQMCDKGLSVAWLRWDLGELAVSMANFEDLLNPEEYKEEKHKDLDVKCYKNINNGACIWFFAVKQATKYKGFDKPINWVVYDEFIPEFYDIKTRRDTEFNKFMSLWVTLKRDNKPFKGLLMSNCIDWFNGYTMAWKIKPFNSGEIRIFDSEMSINFDGTIINNKIRIAFENVRPTPAMINRVLKEEMLKGNDISTIKRYLDNETSTQYNLIAQCPNMKIPLYGIQFRRNDKYYSYRLFNDCLYFVETKKRDSITTDVFSLVNIKENEVRRPKIGKYIEDLLNLGLVRFDNGHTYNAIIMGLWDYRKSV